jgi:hypothetical protein
MKTFYLVCCVNTETGEIAYNSCLFETFEHAVVYQQRRNEPEQYTEVGYVFVIQEILLSSL